MQLNLIRIQRFLLVGLLLIVSALTVAQEAPTALVSDEPISGTLDDDNIADIYTFDGTENSVLSLTISTDIGLGVLIADQSGNAIAETSAADGAVALEDVILAQTGSYFVTVFATDGAGDYEITIRIIGEELVVDPPQATNPSGSFITELPDVADVLLNSGMEVRLQWAASVDLNLEVRDPNGNTLFFDSRTSPIGGSFGFDANGLCEVISDAPVETATWQPGFLPAGSYEILVFYRQNCEQSNLAVPFTLTVTVNGNVLPVVDGTIAPSGTNNDSVYLANFIIEDETTATINTGGAYPDSALNNLPAPAADLQTSAVPAPRDVPTTGALFENQDYIVYSFDAVEGEIVTASMTATSRNLDTLLQLIDPNGNLIAVNDDITGSTNSTISNQRIVQAGTYLLVATRYGKEVGGTEGEFSLVITESTASLPEGVANLVVPQGDIQVYLTWNTNADLQLLVRDPVGNSVYDDVPQVSSGGLLAENGNVACTVSEGDPLSYIYWPNGLLRPGTYEIDVWFENLCNDTSLVEFTLTVVVNGEVVLVERQNPAIGDRFITNFTINPDGTAVAGLAGFLRSGVTTADIEGEEELAILPNVPVQGSLTTNNALDVYTFNASAGQIVTITMQRTSGILDTSVFLLSPAGIQISANDDAPAGSFVGASDRTTDSLISGFTIPADGTYTIVASRFGTIYGGTTGTYQLSLQINQ
ncbi:MAG: PPC domain-containing protein [Phototrophicaceae bacterium]